MISVALACQLSDHALVLLLRAFEVRAQGYASLFHRAEVVDGFQQVVLKLNVKSPERLSAATYLQEQLPLQLHHMLRLEELPLQALVPVVVKFHTSLELVGLQKFRHQ